MHTQGQTLLLNSESRRKLTENKCFIDFWTQNWRWSSLAPNCWYASHCLCLPDVLVLANPGLSRFTSVRKCLLFQNSPELFSEWQQSSAGNGLVCHGGVQDAEGLFRQSEAKGGPVCWAEKPKCGGDFERQDCWELPALQGRSWR